ncbi:MAG: HD domain-containing protein [Geobacteraceae bacterium]|nr:HD domain-containing protein [Geobacteraceae bacterium]
MLKKQLLQISTWFDSFVTAFKAESAQEQRNYDLKIEHTAKVRNNIELLADSLLLPADKRALASIIAICHDVGRFPQYAKYGTFNDATSVNHAALAIQTLKSEGILQILDEVSRDMVIQSIALHNVFLLPDNLCPDELLFARLIRDADKLDIWRVLIEYCTAQPEERASAVVWELPDTGLCSDAAINEVINGRMINRSVLSSADDFKLLQISWAYDLNFKETFVQLSEHGYIDTLAGLLPDQNGCHGAVSAVRSFIKSRIVGASYL